MRGKRRRIGLGIYRDGSGFSICWREAGHQKEARLPLDTPLYRLKDFRREQVERVAKQPRADARHGLARDVVRYLKLRKGRPSYASERSHLRAWITRYPHKSRWALTREDCQLALSAWTQDEVAPQTIRHRALALQRMFHALDGSRVTTPLDDVDIPKRPKRRPGSVPDAIVHEVARRLKDQEETDGRMASAKTRARFLVLATTGQRPAQLMRAQPEHVDLERRLWFVEPAKGDSGTVVFLNDDMLAAFTLFAQANAWGRFSTSAHARCLQRNGWPKHLRPYTLRHTVGLTLSQLGVDLGDISAHMGHSSVDITREFYVPAVLGRLRAASEILGVRGLADLAVPAASAMTARKTEPEKAETRQKTQKSRMALRAGTPGEDREKTA